MKQRFVNIYHAIKIGYWAYKNPQSIQKDNMKMLSDLLGLILSVATEKRHRMSRIAAVHPDEGEKEIVVIWAGAGIAADPYNRITELLKENDLLKEQLSEYVSKNKPNITLTP